MTAPTTPARTGGAAPLLEVSGAHVVYGQTVAVRGVDLHIGTGEVVALLGRNGAGKTSLLRAIAGFLRPRAGATHIETAEEPMLSMHYLGHLNALKGAASVRDHVRYWEKLFGGGDGDNALAEVGLTRQADLPTRVLSQGQARRLALSRLLVAKRPIWLLDEPAAALDTEGRAMLSALIEKHRAGGGVVVAAVHEPIGPMPTQTLRLGA